MTFKRILVANRGEIARRVFRSCRARGIAALAMYSPDDEAALHVIDADAAAQVPGGYLDVKGDIKAATQLGADAIHPGYGFLSEQPALVEACRAAEIAWIGPERRAMEVMGDKVSSRKAMIEADVPVIPGREDVEDAKTAEAVARELGFPLMLKASAGGGGKGMRRVDELSQLAPAFEAASREAEKAFGDPRVFIERAVDGARHIEIQVLADGHGECVYLGERDCSIQRRHQKVIEEAPSPAPYMNPELRDAMGRVACQAALAVDYRGAGTVEFLVEERAGKTHFYFLEMNTRLQVEHPITECITGRDLVDDQIRVAQGEPLGFQQADVELNGHAIECRIYAEDSQRFLPSPGRVTRLRWPQGPGVRVDAALAEGFEVSDRYDPMIAKLICYGRDRAEAVARMSDALAQTVILGIDTNLNFHRRVLAEPDFQAGLFDTGYIQSHPVTTEAWQPGEALSRAIAGAVAATRVQELAQADHARPAGMTSSPGQSGASAWAEAVRWRR